MQFNAFWTFVVGLFAVFERPMHVQRIPVVLAKSWLRTGMNRQMELFAPALGGYGVTSSPTLTPTISTMLRTPVRAVGRGVLRRAATVVSQLQDMTDKSDKSQGKNLKPVSKLKSAP